MSRQPRVFISRTTSGLAALAERAAEVLRQRGIEPIIQTGFYPSTHDVKGMLAEHLQHCDAVICLIGTAYGSGPHDPITKAEQPVHGLKDPRTKDRLFSYTQLELLIARDLGRPIYTFFIQGDALPTAFAPEPPELAQRQQTFITEFAKDGRNTYGTFSQWDQPADPARGLKQAIEAIKFGITVLAGKPTNLPYTSLGTLFKGRDEFLAELRQHLTAEGPVVIKGKRTIHGMGGVGKTRAAIEYAWKHAEDYRALLFISADTPEALHRNLAALCGPLVLNLPEQNEKEQALQVEAALRWLKLHPGWFLIIDNVDTDEAAEETKALLAKLATGHVLITSRISDWTGHVKSLDLDVLSEAASIAFLDERTEERRPKKNDDRENVAALVQLLDCLALALEQAGAHISTTSISYADYIALWESHRPDALAWHDEEKMKYPKSLAITYETSVAQLSGGAKELFNILSWFAPDPIPRRLFDSAPNPSDEKRHLLEIERLHLARYLGDGESFAIHRLNQEITRQQQTHQEPLSLIVAMHWLNGECNGDPEDVRTWPIIWPLKPHAVFAAIAGANRNISEPSVRLLSVVGVLLTKRGEYSEAEALMRRALSISETERENSCSDLATLKANLGALLHTTSRNSEAEPLLRDALIADENVYGPSHPLVAVRLNSLAALLYTTNRLTEAEPLMRRALAIAEANSGESHPSVAIHLKNLGTLLQATNRTAEAELLLRRALAIDESTAGKDHPNFAVSLNNLATLLLTTNRIAEAEPLLRRALEIDEMCFGSDHPDVAIRLSNLAHALRLSRRFGEAEPLMRRSLAIVESAFGPEHPAVALRLNNLAQLLKATGRLAEAEGLMWRGLSIEEKALGTQHPDVARTLNNIAGVLQDTNRLTDSELVMRMAVEILLNFTRSTGHQHPHLFGALNNYRLLLLDMGDSEDEATKKIASVMNSFGISFQ